MMYLSTGSSVPTSQAAPCSDTSATFRLADEKRFRVPETQPNRRLADGRMGRLRAWGVAFQTPSPTLVYFNSG